MAKIAKPLVAGVSVSYNVKHEENIDFLFTESDASFQQHGSSMIVSFHDGSSIVLHNFFSSYASVEFSDGASYTTQSFSQEHIANPIQTATAYLDTPDAYTPPPPSTSPHAFNASTGTSQQSRIARFEDGALGVAPAAGARGAGRAQIYKTPSLDETMEMARTKNTYTNFERGDREYLAQQNINYKGYQDAFGEAMDSTVQQGSPFVQVAGEVRRYVQSPYSGTTRFNPYIDMNQQYTRQRGIRYNGQQGYEEYIDESNAPYQEGLGTMTYGSYMPQSGGIGEYRDGGEEYSIEYTEALGLADDSLSIRGIGAKDIGIKAVNSTLERIEEEITEDVPSVNPTPPVQPPVEPPVEPPVQPPVDPTPPPNPSAPTITISTNQNIGNWDNAQPSDTLLPPINITTDGGITYASLSLSMQQGDSLTLPNGTVISGPMSGSVIIDGLTITYSVNSNLQLSLSITSASGTCPTSALEHILSNLHYWNPEFGTQSSIDTGNRDGSLILHQQDNQIVQSNIDLGYRVKVSGNFVSGQTSKSYFYQGSDASEKVDLSQSSGSNLIVGGGGNNTLIGGSGNDLIIVGGKVNGNNKPTINNTSAVGSSLVEGGNGNDTIIGSAGANTIHGGEGNDLIFGGPIGTDYNRNPLMNSTVTGHSASNVLVGNNGNNTIIAGTGGDKIYGHNEEATTATTTSGGNNLIYAGSGNDTIHAGGGNNTIHASAGHNEIHTGAGRDNIIISGGTNNIHSGNGADSIELQNGNNTLHTGEGNNTVVIQGGLANITGGSGSDSIVISGGTGHNVQTNHGDDTIIINGGTSSINTGDGNDRIVISGGDTHINAGSGNDTIIISNGSGSIDTGTGNNYVEISGGSMNVTSSNGNDIFHLSGGSGHIVTGSGADKVLVTGNFTGSIEFSSGNSDILTIGSPNAVLGNFSVSEAEALYYSSTGNGNHSLSSSQLGAMAHNGDNFVTIKHGNTVLNSHQVFVSGDKNFTGRVDVTGLDGKAAICAKLTLNGETVFAVTFGKDGNVVLVPEHFADNLYFDNMSVKDMVGKLQYDTSNNSSIKVDTGSSSANGLFDAIAGHEQSTTHGRSLDEHDDIDTFTLHTDDDTSDTSHSESDTEIDSSNYDMPGMQTPEHDTQNEHNVKEHTNESIPQHNAMNIPTAPTQENASQQHNIQEQQEQYEEGHSSEDILDFTNVELLGPTQEHTQTAEGTLQLHEVLSPQHTQTLPSSSDSEDALDSVALFQPPTEYTTSDMDMPSVSVERSFGDILMEVQMQVDSTNNGLS